MEKLHNVYSSSHVITLIKPRKMLLVGYLVCMQVVRNVYKIFVTKLEEKSSVATRGRRWEDSIKIDLGYESVSKSFRTESITKYTLTFGIPS
jgi:uncharacterized membrane protein YqhA